MSKASRKYKHIQKGDNKKQIRPVIPRKKITLKGYRQHRRFMEKVIRDSFKKSKNFWSNRAARREYEEEEE